MLIVLFRHGPAGSRDSERWPDDSDRPLTPRGEERTAQAARGIARLLRGEVAAVLTSPLARARQTAEIAGSALDCRRVERLEPLAPGGSYRRTIEAMAAYSPEDTLVLVGHEPDLGKLAGVLVFGAPTPLPLRKAGACAIEFADVVVPGEGVLLWFAPPRALRRLAGRKAGV